MYNEYLITIGDNEYPYYSFRQVKGFILSFHYTKNVNTYRVGE